MPILKDHPEEMDTCYTPLEERRRSEMKIRRIRYGFHRVVTEPVDFPTCVECGNKIYGESIIIDGTPRHYKPCVL